MKHSSYKEHVARKTNRIVANMVIELYPGIDNYFINNLNTTFKPFESLDEELSQWLIYKLRPTDEHRNTLINRYMWLALLVTAKMRSKKLVCKGIDLQDIHSHNVEVLIDCVEHFDTKQDVNFGTYYTSAAEREFYKRCLEESLFIRTPIWFKFTLSKFLHESYDDDMFVRDVKDATRIAKTLDVYHVYKDVPVHRFKAYLSNFIYGKPTPNSITDEATGDTVYMIDIVSEHIFDEPYKEFVNKTLCKRIMNLKRYLYDNFFEKTYSNSRKRITKDEWLAHHYRAFDMLLANMGFKIDGGEYVYLGKSQRSRYEELGALYNITRQRVEQILKSEKRWLRENFNEQDIEDCLFKPDWR